LLEGGDGNGFVLKHVEMLAAFPRKNPRGITNQAF
jgi:hypothetical protein